MHSESCDEESYQEFDAHIDALPEELQSEVVFALFSAGLRKMPRENVVALRAELARRFPSEDETRDLGTALLEIVDGHLALCALRESPDSLSDAAEENS